MWTMMVCTTLTWGLCDRIIYVDYPTKELCYESVELTIKSSGVKPASIICGPKKEEEK
jgi:hypothetical protein